MPPANFQCPSGAEARTEYNLGCRGWHGLEKKGKGRRISVVDDRGPSARRGEWLADPARWAGLRDYVPLGLRWDGCSGGRWPDAEAGPVEPAAQKAGG